MRTLAATLVVLVSGLAFGGETAVKGYLHKQHPEEDNHAQCTSPGPMSTAENSRRTNIESMHKLFPERDVVELNWKPTT